MIFAGVTVFVTVPGVLLVTQTSRVHVVPAGKLGSNRLIEVAPDGAVRVRVAGHPVKFGPDELLTGGGRRYGEGDMFFGLKPTAQSRHHRQHYQCYQGNPDGLK